MEIKNRVKTMRPKNRYQAMQLARNIEMELWSWEEDDEGGPNKSNVFGLPNRQPKAQLSMKYPAGLDPIGSRVTLTTNGLRPRRIQESCPRNG